MGAIVAVMGQSEIGNDAVGLKWRYLEFLKLAGVGAVVLPPTQDVSVLADVLEMADGLFLPGGDDVDPLLFGGARRPGRHLVPERDALETAAIRQTLGRGIPFLGICRGMQLLNVIRGGTLEPLAAPGDEKTPEVNHDQQERLGEAVHGVSVAEEGLLAGIVGPGTHCVNSAHGWTIGRLGDGLQVEARSADGLVEALSVPSAGFAVGVQWHPEALLSHPESRALAEAFGDAVRKRAAI